MRRGAEASAQFSATGAARVFFFMSAIFDYSSHGLTQIDKESPVGGPAWRSSELLRFQKVPHLPDVPSIAWIIGDGTLDRLQLLPSQL